MSGKENKLLWEIKKVDNYSELIDPKTYHEIMREHLYIKETDNVIYDLILKRAKASSKKLKVCEIGAGTGALTKLVANIENIELIAIESDSRFFNILKDDDSFKKKNIKLINQSFFDFEIGDIDIFYSMGVHHHIEKGEPTKLYLDKIYNLLKDDGLYILGDEFIPDYKNAKERTLNLIIWFSHIIEDARKKGNNLLAQEEARTLYYDILGIEDYKNSLEELELELKASNLKLNESIRKGPKDDIGALYTVLIKKK